MRVLLHWVLSALAIWIVSRVVPGFIVSGPAAALIAALVIGLVNATIGFFLKIITFPLTILTLGLFWFVINAVMIELASAFVPGFHILSFASAFWGGIVLSILNLLLKSLVMPSREPR
jgi:putative membrane protein